MRPPPLSWAAVPGPIKEFRSSLSTWWEGLGHPWAELSREAFSGPCLGLVPASLAKKGHTEVLSLSVTVPPWLAAVPSRGAHGCRCIWDRCVLPGVFWSHRETRTPSSPEGTAGRDRGRVSRALRSPCLQCPLVQFYRLLNIKVALIGLEVWTERDQCSVSSDANATLWAFLQWKKSLRARRRHDNAQLLTWVPWGWGLPAGAGLCNHPWVLSWPCSPTRAEGRPLGAPPSAWLRWRGCAAPITPEGSAW